MRWLVDECVDAALVELLRQAGHDVVAVSYIAPRATDLQVMSRAEAEGRLLLTEDKDFGDLAFRRARRVPGIVLLRISSVQRHRKAERLLAAVDRFAGALFGHYIVIEEARFRSRPRLPDIPCAHPVRGAIGSPFRECVIGIPSELRRCALSEAQ